MNSLENNGVINNVYVPVTHKYSVNYNLQDNIMVDPCSTEIDRLIYYTKAKKGFEGIQQLFAVDQHDIIHAHTLFSNGLIAYKIYKKYGIPYIVAVRNTDVNTFFKKMIHLRKVGIKILENASKVVFLSESYKDTVLEEYVPKGKRGIIEEKSVIIPNGIDDYWLHNVYYNRKGITDTIRIVTAGEINKNKNQLLICSVCDELNRHGVNVKYYIAGKKSNRAVYQKVVKNKYVTYVGELTKEELLKLFRECSIYMMTSHTETFGLVYAEALSQGLPVIYTRGQGFDRQFPDGTVGFAVSDNDYTESVAALQRVVNNYDFFCKNALEGCKKYSWGRIGKQYFDIFNDILTK